MRNMRNSTFAVLMFVFAAWSANENRIIVDPTLAHYDSFPDIKTGAKFFVDAVTDTVHGRDDSGIVGYVHTRFNHPDTVVSRPLPAAAVSRSLQTLLEKKDAIAAGKGVAIYLIRVSVLGFNLKETPHFFYQTIAASVQLKVDLVDPGTLGLMRSFNIDSQRSRAVFNSGRNAQSLLRSALHNALAEVVQSLNGQ